MAAAVKILVIHQYYLLPGRPGGSRFNEMARLWAKAGHQVSVIAGTVDYATGERPAEYTGRWVIREEDGRVNVWRCYVPDTYHRSYLGRAWAFGGFAAAACTAVLRAGPHDVVIATSPPLTVVLPGWLAASRWRCPLVFEVRDLWPESAITTGILSRSGILTRALLGLERRAYRHAALINVLTPAFRDDIVRRGLAPARKIVLVPNGADARLFFPGLRDNAARREFGWGSRVVALYAGAHGRANAVGQLVHAAEQLRGRSDILIATVGDGPERVRWQSEAKRRGLDNIQFCGAQPKDRMRVILNAADIGVAVLQNNPTFRTVYPNKIFDYMACARPIVIGIDGLARQLVCNDADAGIFVEPDRPDLMSLAIQELADDPECRARLGHNGRRWVLANASRDVLASQYLEHLRSLLGGGSNLAGSAPSKAPV